MTSINVATHMASARESFVEAAHDVDFVPVGFELHVDALTPVGLFESFVGDGEGFLLESVEDGTRFGRFSFVGRRPLGSYRQWPDRVESTGTLAAVGGDLALAATERTLSSRRVARSVGAPSEHLPLVSGMVGIFGWDCVREIEALPPMKTASVRQPVAALLDIGELVAFDHWRQSCTVLCTVPVASVNLDDAWDSAVSSLQAMVDALSQPAGTYVAPYRGRHDMPIATSTRTISSDQYRDLVREAKEQIAAGEIFQIVLSQRFDVGSIERPFDVYRVLRQMNPSAYLYFLQFDDCTVVGSSPEALVRVRDGRAITRPIAGSRPRGENEIENQLRAASLREDPKEIAEHIMLVDLGRNDIGRVAQYGTVKVDELMTVENYSHIMHLTSQVSGDVREGLSAVDVLRATFPAGTLSGAPKVRAMELITEMEPQARGLYGGAVGYFDARGNFDAAILIRTLVVDADGNGSVQTGAGVVWDSDPAAEDEECLAKAEAILRAVGGTRS